LPKQEHKRRKKRTNAYRLLTLVFQQSRVAQVIVARGLCNIGNVNPALAIRNKVLKIKFDISFMRWIKLIFGELLLLVSSILVFRSAWILLDEYLGKSNLWLMLFLGIILTVIALVILDYEVKCKLDKQK
jgi:hypothetical protein